MLRQEDKPDVVGLAIILTVQAFIWFFLGVMSVYAIVD